MASVEQRTEVITKEESAKLGIGPQENSELQGYLKDRTKGTAGDLVRNNKSGIGLESWRLLKTVQPPYPDRNNAGPAARAAPQGGEEHGRITWCTPGMGEKSPTMHPGGAQAPRRRLKTSDALENAAKSPKNSDVGYCGQIVSHIQ